MTLREDLYGDAPAPGTSDHKYSAEADEALEALMERVSGRIPVNKDGRIMDGDELRELKMFRQRRRP